MVPRPRLALLVLAAAGSVALGVAAPPASAALRHCARVSDPYPGTRYAGVPLSHIWARNVSCTRARAVARGAHRKALGITPNASGYRRFTWRGWRVLGNLRGAQDRYLAVKSGMRVRWRF
jgi:hypothetical protein